MSVANGLLKAVEQYQFVWGSEHVHRRREHRRWCR